MKKPIPMALKVARYLAYRRSLGYELKWEGKALADFGHYADQSGHQGPLTLALALKWARLAATPGHRPWDAPDVGAMAVATLTGRVLGPGHPGR